MKEGRYQLAMKVPLLDLKGEYEELHEEILAALDAVCRKASFVLGEEADAFEREFAAYCGTKHCVAVNTGTAALHLGLLALGVQAGDEVITTPNSFLATAEAVTYCGAKPVLVDIDPATANIDPQRIEKAITKRTRAVLPVHLYGRAADMTTISEIAKRRGLCVLEDAAQAHGTKHRGRRAGGLGDAAAFSFYPTKNLGAYGEAGAVTTNDDAVADFARKARSHGQSARYRHDFVGHNYRIHGFQAAVLRVKLRYLDRWTVRRRTIAAEYRRRLADARVEIPRDDLRDEAVYHQFVIYADNRDGVAAQLAARGIDTAVHYPTPIHLQAAYRSLGHPEGSFPHSERACRRVLSLPLFPAMTDEQAEYVSNTTRDITGQK